MKYTVQEPASSSGDSGAIPEDTVLVATLVALREEEKTRKDGTPFTKLSWRFRVNDAESEFDGRSVFGDTGNVFAHHADCKPWAWGQSLMGFEFPAGFEVETDDFLEKDCRIVVGAREYVKEGETRVANFVTDVMPLGKLLEQAF